MTEKQLITKLQELKQIKPRKDWAVSVKMNILGDMAKVRVVSRPSFQWNFSNVSGLFYQRKFAYAFLALLFVSAGLFSFLKFSAPQGAPTVKVAQQSAKSLAAENNLKNNVEAFKTISKNFAAVTKARPQDSAVAVKEVRNAAKNLTDAIKKDPELAKTIALDVNNNKSYLDIPGGDDLKDTSNALYGAIVDPLIKDLKERSLTKDQQNALEIIEKKHNEHDDNGALQDALLLMNSTD